MDLPTAAILSGEDAKGFKNREHKENYVTVTIAKDRRCSLQHSHSFYQGQLGIARSLAMTAPILAVSHALVTKQSLNFHIIASLLRTELC